MMSGSERFQPREAAERLIASIRDYAIYMLDKAGHVVSWNAGAERFKGYTADEIIGRHFSTFHTPEDQQAGLPQRALATAVRDGKFECEGWRVRKDGTRFWAHVVVDPIFDDSGELAGFAKITRDITEKKRAEAELMSHEQQFRLLVQGVVDYAIYMLSPQGLVSSWNPGAQRIKGYDAHEILGHQFSTFYTPEDRERGLPAHALSEAERSGRYEAEGQRVRKDGSRFWAHVIIDAIRSDDGALLGFAKITRDITEREEAARSLERAREELFQSQKMEAIGQLTGGVAHDFNNLLSIVSTAVQVLDAQGLSPAQKNVLQSINRAVERGAALTGQLLAFARQQPLTPSLQDPNKILGNFETVLRRGVGAHIDLRVRLGGHLNWVNIDEARLEAAILNLVVNARDAMPDGGKLEISTENVAIEAGEHKTLPPGPYVRISVADTGTGMPPEVLARACEPFFTTKPVGKGTGLGLSQVQGFILQSGGALDVHSVQGAGTTITIHLPAIEQEEVQRPGPSEREVALVVEDEPELGQLAGSLFEALGYEVVLTQNGAEALRVLGEQRPIDVLFSDVMMPGISGIELARKARTLMPDLKVILASGYPIPALRAHGGMDDFAFISKPYRLSEIVKKLR
ncbi:MAG: PAS domain S-box protein [Gammaproteobacteria bacterium]